MTTERGRVNPRLALAAAALLAVPLAVGVYHGVRLGNRAEEIARELDAAPAGAVRAEALREAWNQAVRNRLIAWIGVAAAALAMGLLVTPQIGVPRAAYLAAGAAVPLGYVVLSAAPYVVTSEAAGRALLNGSGLVAAVAAGVAYLAGARRLRPHLQYGMCCGVLAMGFVFFMLWEPPPPVPLPPRRPVLELVESLAPPGWTAEHQGLDEAIEKVLAADEYANLLLISEDGSQRASVFIPYNANARTNLPHVPWVCMQAAGYELAAKRTDSVVIRGLGNREVPVNVLYFEPGQRLGFGAPRALMLQHFNAGGDYEINRQVARFNASRGAMGGSGSFLTQTQVSVYLPPATVGDPMADESPALATARHILQWVVPVLEERYYPVRMDPKGG